MFDIAPSDLRVDTQVDDLKATINAALSKPRSPYAFASILEWHAVLSERIYRR